MSPNRSDTLSVSAEHDADTMWDALASVPAWTLFSPFLLEVLSAAPGRFDVRTPQGVVVVEPRFIRDVGLLDHYIVNEQGERTLIPYRVVPNGTGSELIMTNIKSPSDTDEQYEEQVRAMGDELRHAVSYVSSTARSRTA